MANYPALFLNPTTGRPERLLPADGGLQINAVDSDTVNAAVTLFPLLVAGGGGSFAALASFQGTAAIGHAAGTVAFPGAVTVGTTLVVTGAATVNGHATLGNNVAVDTTTFGSKVASDIVFDPAGPRAISLAGQHLTITTTAASNIVVTAAAILDLNCNAATLDAATTMWLVGVGLTTVKSTTADLTLGARTTTINLNDNSNLSLSGFTATTILGALNEVRAAVGTDLPVYKSGEAITAGDVVYLAWHVGNARVEVYKADNTVSGKDRPAGIAKNTVVGAGTDVQVITSGEALLNSVVAATTEGGYLYLTTNGKVVQSAVGLTGTITIVGIGSMAGIAGVARCIYQPHIPYTV
jgi:hypothetical protein